MLRPETTEEKQFREGVRAWLSARVPADLRHRTFRPAPERAMEFYRALSARGWIAPHWPRAFGGMQASPVEQVILMEEMARIGAPDLPTQGLNHIGPLLMKCGSDAQRARHLPPILRGDVIWCQGYSEPGAGSDLASLRTRGVVRGDRLLVSGHKIWTTWGHHADWMFALVRTGEGATKQEGITFVLLDLHSPGIARRPIRTIAGDDEFCEVFLDEVEVPLENVVGRIGEGWGVATALLNEERIRVAAPIQAFRALVRLRAMVGAQPEPWLEGRVAEAEIEVETLVAAFLEVAEDEEGGGSLADSSYLKILATETVQHVLDVLQEAAARRAAVRTPRYDAPDPLDFSEMFLQARRLSIYAGSNEIQRSILAARVLDMRSSRRSS